MTNDPLAVGGLLILITFLIEAFTQLSKEVASATLGRDLSPRFDVALAVAWGLILACVFRLDLFRVVSDLTGYPVFAPAWLGMIATGLLGRRLSNFLHDVATKLEKRSPVAPIV